jgi:hypothetical protein
LNRYFAANKGAAGELLLHICRLAAIGEMQVLDSWTFLK